VTEIYTLTLVWERAYSSDTTLRIRLFGYEE